MKRQEYDVESGRTYRVAVTRGLGGAWVSVAPSDPLRSLTNVCRVRWVRSDQVAATVAEMVPGEEA